MTVKFLSEEWAKELQDRLNANDAFTKGIAGQTVKLQQVIAGTEGQTKYWLVIDGGKVEMGVGDVAAPDVTITQDYETAVGLARSELNPVTAFMMGKLKVDNLTRVLGLQGAFANLPAVMAEMDVDY